MAGRSAKKKNSTAPLKKAVTLIAVFVVLLFTVLDLTGLVSFDSLLIKAGVEDKPAEHAQTEVHFIDVGQGDSTLVISQGEAMLIDSGDKDDSNKIESTLQNIEGKDYLQYEWIDLDKIDEYPLRPDVLKEVLKESKFPVHKINIDKKEQ